MTKTTAIFAGSKADARTSFYGASYKLGLLLGRHGHHILWGGGQNGLMGALQNGVSESSKGTMTAHLDQKYYNPDFIYPSHVTDIVIHGDGTSRNKAFMQADFQIALPGGFGTFAEIAYTIDHKTYADPESPPLLILNTDRYYENLRNQIAEAVVFDFNSPAQENRVMFVDTPEQASKFIRDYTPN